MLINWNNIMFFLTRPRIFLLKERLDDIEEVELSKDEHQKLLRIIKGKILPNARVTSNGKLFVKNEFFSQNELKMLLKTFKEYISKEDDFELADENLLEKTWFIGTTIELLTYCPFRCPHCVLPAERRRQHLILPEKSVINIVRRLGRKGLISCAFTGGEPTFYPHDKLIKIIDIISDSALILMNTNAYNFTERLVKKLAEYGILIKISLYGCDFESYYKFTGVKNAYSRVKKSLEMLNKYDARFIIQVIYTNLHKRIGIGLEEMVNFARQYTSDVLVNYAFFPGWGGREKTFKLTEKSVERELKKLKIGACFTRYQRYIKSVTLPEYGCPLSKIIDVFVTAEGVTLACPFFDEVCAHISNPQWPAIHYLKIIAHRSNPWPGGRCGILWLAGMIDNGVEY